MSINLRASRENNKTPSGRKIFFWAKCGKGDSRKWRNCGLKVIQKKRLFFPKWS